MKCKKCGNEIDECEANLYYANSVLIDPKDLKRYPIAKVKAICHRCMP